MPAKVSSCLGSPPRGRQALAPDQGMDHCDPIWMNRVGFFRLVTIALLSRANAAALRSVRGVPQSLRAAARLQMFPSVPCCPPAPLGHSGKLNCSSPC
jgi:hypothetical protein